MSGAIITGCEVLDGVPTSGEVASITGPVDQGPTHDAPTVDEEGPPDGETLVVEDAVPASGLTVGPEVGQQGEEVGLLVRPRPKGKCRVARHGEDLDLVVVEGAEIFTDLAELAGADAAEGEREEDQQDRTLGPRLLEPHD